MAQNPANIHIGAARIFLGVTPPVTGSPPSLTAHVDGEPTTGTEVGYTQDAASFTYKQNKQEVVAEQSLNPVDVFVVNEEISIEFTAMEHVYVTLKAAFDNVGSIDDAQKMLFFGGDGGGLVSVQTQCVVLTSRIRTAPSKFEVLTLYRVYNMEGVSIPYNRTGEAVYKITLKGLTDTSRSAGDRLFQWYREKGGLTATGAVMGTPGVWTPPGSVAPTNLTGMGPVQATPLSAWAVGTHMVLGNGSKVYWNGTAWIPTASGAPAVKATTATAGLPGTFGPSGAQAPADLAALNSAVDIVTAIPATTWANGQYVRLADLSSAYWDVTGTPIYKVGTAPPAADNPEALAEGAQAAPDAKTNGKTNGEAPKAEPPKK
jgi:hypothetical protein